MRAYVRACPRVCMSVYLFFFAIGTFVLTMHLQTRCKHCDIRASNLIIALVECGCPDTKSTAWAGRQPPAVVLTLSLPHGPVDSLLRLS